MHAHLDAMEGLNAHVQLNVLRHCPYEVRTTPWMEEELHMARFVRWEDTDAPVHSCGLAAHGGDHVGKALVAAQVEGVGVVVLVGGRDEIAACGRGRDAGAVAGIANLCGWRR